METHARCTEPVFRAGGGASCGRTKAPAAADAFRYTITADGDTAVCERVNRAVSGKRQTARPPHGRTTCRAGFECRRSGVWSGTFFSSVPAVLVPVDAESFGSHIPTAQEQSQRIARRDSR